MSTTAPAVRFRHSGAITVAAVIAMISGISLVTWAPYLLPVLVIPLVVAVWNWRSGTDADAEGLTVRAAVAKRHVPWSTVSGLAADERGRVNAQLTSGNVIGLPAVSAGDLPRLVQAAGKELVTDAE